MQWLIMEGKCLKVQVGIVEACSEYWLSEYVRVLWGIIIVIYFIVLNLGGLSLSLFDLINSENNCISSPIKNNLKIIDINLYS